MQPAEKGRVMFYCHTQTNDILKLSGTNGTGVLLDGTLLSFVYEPYQAKSW